VIYRVKKKNFFFEKKKQKTFSPAPASPDAAFDPRARRLSASDRQQGEAK